VHDAAEHCPVCQAIRGNVATQMTAQFVTCERDSGSIGAMSDPRTAPYRSVRLADVDTLAQVDPGNPDINPGAFHLVRRHFDVQAFGVNAVTGSAGDASWVGPWVARNPIAHAWSTSTRIWRKRSSSSGAHTDGWGASCSRRAPAAC